MIHVNALSGRLSDIAKTHQYQAARLRDINKIMSMKRMADQEYCKALQLIDREISRYLEGRPGFMNEMLQSYQSYLAILYQQKMTMMDSYQHDVIEELLRSEAERFDPNQEKKIHWVEAKVIEQLQQKKAKLSQLYLATETIKADVKMREKVGQMTEAESEKFNNRYKEVVKVTLETETKLLETLQQLENVSQLYIQSSVNQNIMKKDLEQFKGALFIEKAKNTHDILMKVFVAEVAYMKSIQSDIGAILKKLKDSRQESKPIHVEEIQQQPGGQMAQITNKIWDTYKNLTRSELNLRQPFIQPEARKKWEDVCRMFSSYQRPQ